MTPVMRRMTDERDREGRPIRVIPGRSTPARSAGPRPGPGETSPSMDPRHGRSGEDESALVAAFLVGDDRAFAALVERNEELVLRIVRRYFGEDGELLELADNVHPGERFSYRMELRR